MRNKFLFSATVAACLAALAADAKTVVTPIARTLSPATYYSASAIVVPGSARPADVLSVIYPGNHPADMDGRGVALLKPAFVFSFGFQPEVSALTPGCVHSTVVPFRATSPPALPDVVASPNSLSLAERTRPKFPDSKTVASHEACSLDELVRKQRANHEKQVATAKKRRLPGRHHISSLDRISVRVCIAPRSARIPRAAHRLVPKHTIAPGYAVPLTRAEIEKKKEHAREYRLGYARKSKHLRRLSPDRIAKLKFFPPLRRFDTDVLVFAPTPTQPVIAYAPVPADESVLYATAGAAGVQKNIRAYACADDIIGRPSNDVCISGVYMNGNVPAKTGLNGIFYAAANPVALNTKATTGFIEQSVALRNIQRGGLHEVTYDELGHSPPMDRG